MKSDVCYLFRNFCSLLFVFFFPIGISTLFVDPGPLTGLINCIVQVQMEYYGKTERGGVWFPVFFFNLILALRKFALLCTNEPRILLVADKLMNLVFVWDRLSNGLQD